MIGKYLIPIGHEVTDTAKTTVVCREQSCAAEACWAHNIKVLSFS